MDDLRRRHDEAIAEGGQIASESVAQHLIVDPAIGRDERLTPERIEHIERRHDPARVPFFEDVGVAPHQLRCDPLLHELRRDLIAIRFAEDWRKGGRARLGPDPLRVLLDQA